MVTVLERRIQHDYAVGHVLGTGGFSVVHKGVHIKEGSPVAIKTIKKLGFLQAPSFKGGRLLPPQIPISETLLANEILVMKHIVEEVSPHPNVIHLHDVYEDEVGVHFVLELCSGGELFDRIVASKCYSEAAAATVIRQIASGLKSLHASHIVHRDLKPENCLFLTDEDDSPLKIMDFGLSQIEGVTNPIVGMFGSIDYVAPEVLEKRLVLPAGDMWSLGVILYILLCGYPPFYARTNREKQALILAADFSFEDTWKTVSQSAKHLISSLLAYDPHKRPCAAELLDHPWVRGDAAKQEPLEQEIFQRLQSFNARRKFRAAAFASIISSTFMFRTKKLKSLVGYQDLTEEELKNLHEYFRKICSNGAGATLSEFEEVLRAMEFRALLPLSRRIFEIFDNDGSGTVDIREIVGGFSSLRKCRGDEALKLCFQMYDTDGSGYISRDELASMFRALPEVYLPGDIAEPGKLDEMFERMDTNNDGRVSFEEFKDAMQLDQSLRKAVLSPLERV
ncbi:hypothetical protein GOP47_0000394 [Adiantum capillus-veneris]|uniref:calcium/calmodulin-dependent protein kinase n=1 Tax=Adiantum capillus-veneris TaxID=13818 RepID=A0A9D4VCY2_ADICA|nr:hypothetical protein GOP47_0000394 [Adiantum capillus-veneris]